MKEKYSPMMQQYLDIKKEHQDMVLMFRLGDFYEMFFDDALAVSKALNLTLTGKNAGVKERVPMCGVPFHSASQYIQKLIDLGFKVAIAEQLSEPGKSKIVERGVVQIITPGTIFDENVAAANNYLGCFKEFDFNYVLAYCDITTGELKTVTIEKNSHLLKTQLDTMAVREIVVESDCEHQFEKVMVSHFDDFSLNDQYRKLFENITDLKQIKVSSLLINYLVYSQKKDLSHLQAIEEIKNEDYLMMDSYTRDALELVRNANDHQKYGSLFWLLDKTKTAMGSRLLKTYIERPLVNAAKIQRRLDIVSAFNDNFLLRASLNDLLENVYDLERLASKVALGNLNARDLTWIGKSLKVVPEIRQTLNLFNQEDIAQLAGRMVDMAHLTGLIDQAIVTDPPLQIKDGGIIKDGYHEELDELRNLRDHGNDWLLEYEARLKKETGIERLKIGYNRVFGYYIEVTKSNLHLVKDEFEFTRKQSLTSGERFITPELKDMEAKILSASDRIVKLEYEIFVAIRSRLLDDVHLIQDIAKAIGQVDVLLAFSNIATSSRYIRPVFTDLTSMEIIGGRHGVMEKVMKKQTYVENDIIVDQTAPILMITGPNMGGKSTYMRQGAFLAIMAQIGCYVPAKKAILPIFDQIFTRIGASDDLFSGQSTFMVEMVEANNALLYATKKSLIIFDEIGRGTATFDGMAIAQAMLEYIGHNINCITFFSTHYHELTFLQETGIGVKNVHASADVKSDDISFEYRIKPGRSNKSYGINVAKLANLPEAVIARANVLLESLEENNIEHKLASQSVQIVKQESEVEKLLQKIDVDDLSPRDAWSTLAELKKLIG
ncbi:MAG: DNA mismatch repair protein MutS [Erysipelotrichaceae bacterium]|nr:DNA mismatch repair protein MutS [Erysipelotrichaceae bacterium]